LGLILDTTILIAHERSKRPLEELLLNLARAGEVEVGLSAVSMVELTHGVYRERSDADKNFRRAFSQTVMEAFVVYPLSLEIAQLAGRIEGEQAAQGITIPFEDLLIGATALYLGWGVATTNQKHFQLIPGLRLAAF
jgi:tRNA(fMet)-specific endonuclease VapC